jgi:hypothetical protein
MAGMGSAASEIIDLMKSSAEGALVKVVRTVYDREALLVELLGKNAFKPLVRGRKYTRNDVITTAGDIRILEKWEGITSYGGDPVSEIHVRFNSRSGRQADCRCESLTPN